MMKIRRLLIPNRIVSITVLSLILTFTFSQAALSEASKKEADYLALAALLVKGGDYQDAEEALTQVDTSKKKFDFVRYYTIKGLVKLKLQNFTEAKGAFTKAIESGQTDKIIHVYLAQVNYALKDFKATVDSIENAEEVAEGMPRIWMLKYLAYWSMKDYNNAWDALVTAESHFPDEKKFVQKRVFLLIELGMYQAAVELGMDYLAKIDAEADDYKTIGKAMIQAGQSAESLPLLEQAVLRFPEDEQLLKTLSRAYMAMSRYYSAANILSKAGALNPALYSETAELYRKALRITQALYYNQMIDDQKEKYKQRLAIYLDAQRFDDVVSMEETLYRVGLLNDGAIRYALAYANFSIGDYKAAEKHLDGIQQADIFRKATKLRKAMITCQKSDSRC